MKLCFPAAAVLLALALSAALPASGADGPDLGVVEVETKSAFSHIRVYKKNNVRTLVFVRDNGQEAYESQVDLDKPYELPIVYQPFMFTSYLFRTKHEKVLIVGLGGGSMVHFLRRYDPEVQIDAVEIDPTVVELAKKYFGVKEEEKVKLLTADGLKYLETTEAKYDVIYMDAFLKPSAETDKTGAPLHLRTLRFYESIQSKLTPGGLVVFNLNSHPDLSDDLATIRKGFRQTYVFRLPKQQGMVVAASAAAERESPATIRSRAQQIDRRFQASFSLERLAKNLER